MGNVDKDLTAECPKLAKMLCLWMPHATSAQPQQDNPFVSFKITDVDRMTKTSNYGESFGDNSYTSLVKRAWVTKKGDPKLGGINPQDDAVKEQEPATGTVLVAVGRARLPVARAVAWFAKTESSATVRRRLHRDTARALSAPLTARCE